MAGLADEGERVRLLASFRKRGGLVNSGRRQTAVI